ncbi:SDR family oxidoreductase [Rhodocaloribacter litoris]|uniref:SDR family oxidoreductase n=1 Tax=Rhodocaloribacter litoris TaxID=2558931 RepID=UPI0014247092|nr:SDR family oxidoreductase [Rhodocaloribacter litoris]QXD16686.1 SDR family oxidoreductase [Rhodocaloribacter litoris]
MKTLVTGATGLVGAALTRLLVAQGVEVRILRRPASRLDLLGDAAGHVEHALGDVTDPGSLRGAFEGVSRVYHVAGYVGQGRNRRERARLFHVNVEGTAHVVDAALAAGVERLVHTSSVAALGRLPGPDVVLDETASWHDAPSPSPYALSKYRAELEVQRGVAEGLDAVIVNPALVFGPGRPGENTRRLVDLVRKRRLPAVPAGGTCVVDVEDVAEGHIRAMAHGHTGERYILAGDNLSWREIAETLARAFGVPPPRWTLSPRLAWWLGAVAEAVALLTRTSPRLTREMARHSAHRYRYSNRKAVEALGCRFRPFRETAQRLAATLREEK